MPIKTLLLVSVTALALAACNKPAAEKAAPAVITETTVSETSTEVPAAPPADTATVETTNTEATTETQADVDAAGARKSIDN